MAFYIFHQILRSKPVLVIFKINLFTQFMILEESSKKRQRQNAEENNPINIVGDSINKGIKYSRRRHTSSAMAATAATERPNVNIYKLF